MSVADRPAAWAVVAMTHTPSGLLTSKLSGTPPNMLVRLSHAGVSGAGEAGAEGVSGAGAAVAATERATGARRGWAGVGSSAVLPC